MAEQQTIKYAPQWNNMTMDNVIFQTNNVVGNFNYPPNVPAHKPIMKFLRNCPLYNAFTNCPSMDYQNFLREFWSTAVAFDPFPSTNEPEKRPLKEFLIKFLVSNGQRPLTLILKPFVHQLALIIIMDPSKVTDIELTAYMIVVNNQKDSMSPLLLAVKPKKRKSQTVTSTLPKSQGPEASRALSKKSKRPKSKKPPTETNRDIQLAGKGLPSTLDEGTRKSKPLPEGTATHPKDSRRNKQPLYRDITFTTPNEGTAKTMPHPEKDQNQSFGLRYQCLTRNKGEPSYEGEPNTQPMILSYADIRAIIFFEDEAHRSEEDILGAGEEMDDNPQSDETHHQSSLPQEDKPTSPHTKAFDTDSLSDKILKKITEDHWEKHEEAVVHYVNLKASIDNYCNENIIHKDQTDKLVEAFMSSLKKSSTTISDLYKDATSIKSMMTEMYNAFRGQSSLAPSSNVTLTFALTDTLANVKGENTTHTTTKEPPSHTKGETDANIQEKTEEPNQSTYANIEEGKGISTDNQAKDQRKLVKASSIARPDLDEPEEARLNDISKTKVIKVVREEAKKLGIHPKEAITTKAGELFKKAQDVKHKDFKRQHTEKVRKSLELRKHKYDSYMWTVSSRLKPKPITNIKIHLKTKPVVVTVYRGIDGRNFDVHKLFLFGTFGISKLDELREIIPKKKNTMVKDLMNSLIRMYERLRQIHGEHRIQSALPAPKQALSQTLGRKRKHIDQAFQRWSDIDNEVIENGATLSKTQVLEGVTIEMPITTTKDKDQRRLEDAKKLLEAVEKRFDRNAATKKTQRNLLKQQYENFTAPSSEMLDQTFDRPQKLVSQL
nr:hypothetical protein [Tanacetum cinerariifolium]